MRERVSPPLWAADPESWVWHRMAPTPVRVDAIRPPETVTARSLGMRTTSVAAPNIWPFSRPPTVERDPRFAGFKRYDARSVVSSSDSTCDAWLDAAAHARGKLSKIGLSPEIYNGELPHWEKLVIQRGTLMHAFISPISPPEAGPALPDRWLHFLDKVIGLIAAEKPDSEPKRDPALTSGGFPSFVSGPVGKVMSALLAGGPPDWKRILGTSHHWCGLAGVSPLTAQAFGVTTRSGPISKPTDQLQFVGEGVWRKVFSTLGANDRTRPVHMASSGLNRVIRPLYHVLNTGRSRLRGLRREGGLDATALLKFKRHYGADFSRGDTTVRATIHDALAFYFTKYWPHLSYVINVWREEERLPTLTPSWGLVPGQCTIVYKDFGGEPSGIKTTSVFWAIVNLTTTLWVLDSQGFNADAYPHQHDFEVFISGDDMRLSCDKEIDEAQYAGKVSEIGLIIKIQPDDTFLATHLGPELANAPLAGRNIQQFLSNEKEELEDESKLGLAYLGGLARTVGSERWPQKLQELAWSVIQHAEWIQALPKAKSLIDLRERMLASRTVLDEIEKALLAKASAGWYLEHVRNAEHSATSQAIVEFVARAGISLGERIEAVDELTDKVCYAVMDLDSSARVYMALDGWFAIGHGPTDSAVWLTKVMRRLGGGHEQLDQALGAL